MIKQAYKKPILISVLLHLLILACFFVIPRAQKPIANQGNIIKAVAINEALQPVQEANKTSQVQPVAQNTIRQIEQTTLKQPEVPQPAIEKTEIVKKIQTPPELPTDKDIPSTLEVPPLQKLATKQQEEKRKQIKEKEAQHFKKQHKEEAAQLQKELDLAAKQMEKNPVKEKSVQAAEEVPSISDQEGVDTQEKQPEGQVGAGQSGEIDKYKQMIVQAIGRNWLMPEDEDKELTCQLLVHLGPGGTVLSVEILKPSGSDQLDRSAKNSILKASPLPVPQDAALFDSFRALRLTFRPQGVISE